jgi:hypothetical protein
MKSPSQYLGMDVVLSQEIRHAREPAGLLVLKSTGVQCVAMPKVLRLLAFLLLAFTVPVQGIAALMAGQCMALGHHQDDAGHGGHGYAQRVTHGHAGTDSHDHAAHSHSDGGVGKSAEDNTEGQGTHCGPCVACCASTSIAGPTTVAFLSSSSNAPYLLSQLPPLGIQPDGLDRPPLAL